MILYVANETEGSAGEVLKVNTEDFTAVRIAAFDDPTVQMEFLRAWNGEAIAERSDS